MRIVFFGDVVGKTGRQALLAALPGVKATYAPDLTLVNIENAAHGFGVTSAIARQFLDAGFDALTTGNHVWDKDDIFGFISREERLLRPLNYPATLPGKGWVLLQTAKGKRVLVVNAMGTTFMAPTLDSPFAMMDTLLERHTLGQTVDAIFVDFHAETTSEKHCFAWHLDGRVSAVVGTHTHVPTADARIFPKGTAYMTDVGMCGDYTSIIGVQPTAPVDRFVKKYSAARMEVSEGPATVCGVVIDLDPATGLATAIAPLRAGKDW